jgi:hypothetical protein
MKHTFFVFAIFFTNIAFAEDYIERIGRIELNWANGRASYYGTAILDQKADTAWRGAEQRAWSEGLTYLKQNMLGALGERIGPADTKLEAQLGNLVSATTSKNTTFYGDGRIKVSLEVPVSIVEVKNAAAPATGVTETKVGGELVVRANGKALPTLYISVVDEAGASLVTAAEVASAATGRGFGARWFKRSMGGQKAQADSGKTQEIKARYATSGTLVVARSDWTESMRDLVLAGKTVVILQ